MWERSIRAGRQALIAAVIAAMSGVALAGSNSEAGSIRWDGKRREAAEIGAALGARTRAALELWAPWAVEHGYRFEVEEAGRMVLVVDARTRSVKRSLKIVAQVLDIFDELLPPGPLLLGEAQDGSSPAVGEARPGVAASAAQQPDTVPVVFALRAVADYGALLDALQTIEPYLADWATSARATSGGFALASPLAAGWVEAGEGREEWSPENELAHRLAHVTLLERFGALPFWLQTGLCWQIEQEALGDIYSFPYRAGFVGTLDHGGWEPWLKSAFKKRKKAGQVAPMTELAAWQRGSFVEDEAARAWGTARFLVQHRPDALPIILADLADYRTEHEIETFPDGRWIKIAGYQVPIDQQDAIFARHLGDDYRDEITTFFRKGRSYRSKR